MEIFMDKIYWDYWVSNESTNVETQQMIRQKPQVFPSLLVICKVGMKRAIKSLRKMGVSRMFTKQVGRVQ
ncbi:hypothetical protein ABH14_17785 [Brevibacillus brevis]|nr:hypothetical protein [Brevibacillus brevis]